MLQVWTLSKINSLKITLSHSYNKIFFTHSNYQISLCKFTVFLLSPLVFHQLISVIFFSLNRHQSLILLAIQLFTIILYPYLFLFSVLERQCQTLARFFERRGDYKCFSVDDPGGLVVILQDLMSYEDDELRICSANLLYAIYKVE